MRTQIPALFFLLIVSICSQAQSLGKKSKEIEITKDTAYWNGETAFILKEGKRPTFEAQDFKGQTLFTVTVESYNNEAFQNASNPTGTKIYWNFEFDSIKQRFDTAPITYGLSTSQAVAKFIMVNKLINVKVEHFVKYATLNPEAVKMAVSMYGNRQAEERKKVETRK